MSASDFNLMASTRRRDESRGSVELWMLLKDLGDPRPLVDKSGVYGIIIAETRLEPLETIGKLREELKRRPEAFQHLIRVIPVEVVVHSELEKIKEAAQDLSKKIDEESSFRITVEKRRTAFRSLEIIEAVAEHIERRVDLENPGWVVLIEVIGKYTGISVLRPTDILHCAKERRITGEDRGEHTAQ